jgi:hypothetical protein
MKRNILIILLLVTTVIFNGCSKDSSSSDAAAFSNPTGTAGSLSRFTIVGNYLYAVDISRLNVFDISNPLTANKVGSQEIGFDIETIFPYGDKLFIGSSNAMFIYSLTNPASPQQLSTVQHLRACDPVVANDTVAYVTLRTGNRCNGVVNALNVYNVRNVTQPVLLRQINLTNPIGLGYSGNALYVCDKQNLRVFDITNGTNPLLSMTIAGTEEFYDVIPYGNLLICYVDKGVSFYDITTRRSPVFLSKLTN